MDSCLCSGEVGKLDKLFFLPSMTPKQPVLKSKTSLLFALRVVANILQTNFNHRWVLIKLDYGLGTIYSTEDTGGLNPFGLLQHKSSFR